MEQMKIIFFFILMLSSAAEDKKSNFTRVQGGSVTFTDPVLKTGSLIFEDRIIAILDEGKFRIWDKTNKDKVFWDNKTGLFTLRGLQRKDSGIFGIESEDREGIITYHELSVYEPVSAPEVTKLNVSPESCTLLCEVQKAEKTTLYWYRDTEILNQTNRARSLSLTVHKEGFTSSYRCVAENPADNKTAHVNVTTLCSRHRDTTCSSQTQGCDGGAHSQSWFFLVPVLLFWGAAAVGLVLMSVKRRRERKRERERERETERADLN